MVEFLTALAVAFGVVFIAELGDKTQLLALDFGARFSLRTVAIGLTLGYAAANVVATIVGGILGAALPTDRSSSPAVRSSSPSPCSPSDGRAKNQSTTTLPLSRCTARAPSR